VTYGVSDITVVFTLTSTPSSRSSISDTHKIMGFFHNRSKLYPPEDNTSLVTYGVSDIIVTVAFTPVPIPQAHRALAVHSCRVHTQEKKDKTEYSGGRMRCFLPTALMDPENKCTQKNTHLTISPAQQKNARKNVGHRTCAIDRCLARQCCGGSLPPECVIQCSASASCKKTTMIAADAIYTTSR